MPQLSLFSPSSSDVGMDFELIGSGVNQTAKITSDGRLVGVGWWTLEKNGKKFIPKCFKVSYLDKLFVEGKTAHIAIGKLKRKLKCR